MKKEVKIGLIGILALAILILGINYLKGVNMLKASSYYYVEYTDINGLAISSPVFASGYKIGLVRDIQYNHANPGHVVVEVELDKEMNIPKGSTGELVTEMLGTVKMNLKLNLTSKEYCQAGDTLPGFVNNGLMGVAEGIMPKVESLMPKMDSILHSLNQLLSHPALTATLENTERLTANLDVTTLHLKKLVQNDLPVLTGSLTTMANNFSQISENLKGIDYAETFSKIDSTLSNIQLLTTKLNSKDNTAGLLFNDPGLYNQLNATATNAASLLKDFQVHPKRYVHFSLFGRKEKTEKE